MGASQNAFAVEGFIDELAHAGRKDPVELRRQLLKGHADWLHVLDTVAQKANWGKAMPPGTAQGVAIAESYGYHRRRGAEVSVSRGGEVRVESVSVPSMRACGESVDRRRADREQRRLGLTAALYGQITINRWPGGEGNFDDYPMLRLNGMPEMETLGAHRGTKWEALRSRACTSGPAVCNAIFKITGKRIRSLRCGIHNLAWS